MFENSKGFCLPHFGIFTETAENKLNDAQKEDFYAIAFPLDAGKYGTAAKGSLMVCGKE